MKRTYPANIDGQIFYIDEDAYLMLQDYLQQLRLTFKGTEGTEIVGDIESRIRELFEERVASGANVIVKTDVTAVIETMGRPEQISGEGDGESTSTSSSPAANPEHDENPFISFNTPTRKRLYRNMKNKVFGGVLGGVATYLGWNANILRLLYAVLACCNFIFPMFIPMLVLYLLGWMIIPPARTPRQILEMKGEPVNVDTVGQTFMANSPTAAPADSQDEGNSNFVTDFFSIVGKVIMGFLGLVGSAACLGGLITFISVGICQFSYSSGLFPDIHFQLPWEGETIYYVLIMLWSLVGAIAGGALAWASACVLFNAKAASKTTKITVLIMEILLISFGIAVSVIAASM